MAHVRCQVVLQGATNLPEDRFINVWNFDSGATNFETHSLLVAAALDNFYGATDMVAAGVGISNLFSQFVLRPYSYRFYDMTQAEPRVPYVINKTLKPYPSTSGIRDLPEEVAIVLSLRGAPPVTARRRGRLYIGPLNHLAITDATTALPVRVDSTVQTALATAADGVLDADVGWAIWSPTSSTLVPVVGGFIDNAVDTQRRRGPAASARLNWPLP